MSKQTEALKLALETAEGIAICDWRKWEELASPEEFERWVKNRALHMATALREALMSVPDGTHAPEVLEQPEQTVSMDEYKRLQELVTSQGVRLMEYESEQSVPKTLIIDMADYELMQLAFEALEDMMKEFRSYDLPYGSKAYAKAKDARLDLYARLAKSEQRTWVGLTEKEIDELWEVHHDGYGYPLSASGYERAIESKLREKNT